MFDAWGKLPSGILYGNYYSAGNYDQCLNIESDKNDESSNNEIIRGQYCLVDFIPDNVDLYNDINYVQLTRIILKPIRDM